VKIESLFHDYFILLPLIITTEAMGFWQSGLAFTIPNEKLNAWIKPAKCTLADKFT